MTPEQQAYIDAVSPLAEWRDYDAITERTVRSFLDLHPGTVFTTSELGGAIVGERPASDAHKVARRRFFAGLKSSRLPTHGLAAYATREETPKMVCGRLSRGWLWSAPKTE